MHVSTGAATSGFVDLFLLKDAAGNPLVPGSTVKGNLRGTVHGLLADPQGGIPQHTTAPGCSCALCLLFGAPGFSPGALIFSDLNPTVPVGTGIRTGIAIDRRRRVGHDEALFTAEIAVAPGILMDGEIAGVLDTDRVSEAVALIFAALKLSRGMGFAKSRGLGAFELTKFRVLGDGREYGPEAIQEFLGRLNLNRGVTPA